MYDKEMLTRLVGARIKKIFINGSYLKFETDLGDCIYRVEGDCCSSSVFHDFIGVKKLLAGNPVVEFNAVTLDESRTKLEEGEFEEEVQCYGYEIVTEDPKFGKVTSVFSFRNYSNGYYGGWMESCQSVEGELKEITDDILEVQS